MKRILSILLMMLMLFTCVNVSAYNPIIVEINSEPIEFDVSPINIQGRVLVPVRAIFEALGAQVYWNPETETVTSTLNDTTVSLTINSIIMTVNDKIVMLDVSPVIISERTMVPVRAVSEAFNATVSWNEKNNCVEISAQVPETTPKETEHFTLSKTLANEKMLAEANFSVSYIDQYDIITDSADGTDFRILCSSDSYFAEMSIRTDIYTGSSMQMTSAYAQSLGKSIASAVHGTYVSGRVTKIGGREFIEVCYHGSADADSSNNVQTNVSYYTTVHNGIAYTMTCITYGDVPSDITSDMSYMMKTLIIQ